MAILDTRLLPLIETLVASGADWLAFEVIEGVRIGRSVEETSERLKMARHAVRTADRQTRHLEETPQVSNPVPIIRDAQIEWAADYVGTRLADVGLMLQSALAGLNAVVYGAFEGRTAEPGDDAGVTLQLEIPEGTLKMKKADLESAISSISSLREALVHWSGSARHGDEVE